ncbi:hypothetical protein HPB51_004405 [Rhipicephalus microplus]|uniref:non-specific serine/threonine protein kinase n=1 Tax=Rhipicephalus microplus TaxID=6941 RepID=A0A9J6EM03_RHIMP|nr:hypothetical protein HPB51_004405 [Rhipicephalus microplus]
MGDLPTPDPVHFDDSQPLLTKKVYKVRSLDDGRWYAVKVASRQFRGHRDRRLKLQEVAKHELLPPHPHCVRFIKAWEEDHRLYILTELCECSLAAYAEKHHDLSEQFVLELLVDLLLVRYAFTS